MKPILFSLEAVGGMLVECYRGSRGYETGGILVGPQSNERIITDIIPSTSFAERRAVTYYQTEKDVELLNEKLRNYQAKGCDFKGYFHKHPSGMKSLSAGDKGTCFEILTSPNYKINNLLIMCIITETQTHSFPLFSYLVSLNQSKKIIIQETTARVLPQNCIAECIDCFEPLKKGATSESIHIEQSLRRIKGQRKSRAVRTSRKQRNNHQLNKRKQEPKKNRNIREAEKSAHQNLKV